MSESPLRGEQAAETSSLQAALLLFTQLQDISQRLAAACSLAGIYEVVFRPAMTALGAVDGAVMLVDQRRQDLTVKARGASPAGATIWRDGPLGELTPATQALSERRPLYFERAGDLNAAYPGLEETTGGQAAVATAVLPLVLDDQPAGVLVLDFRDPHHFTAAERRFLETLAAQTAIALGRVQVANRLEQEVQYRTAALSAFVAFTEQADSEIEVLALAKKAVEVLTVLFPGSTSGYYELDGGKWKVREHTPDLYDDPPLLQSIMDGMPLDTPIFARALETGRPVFVDHWNAERELFGGTQEYQTVATCPFVLKGEACAVLALGLKTQAFWLDHDRSVFQAVGQSLALALTRTEVARQLQLQNAELLARTRALEALATLSTEFTSTRDLYRLVSRSQEVALSLLPGGCAVYYEPADGLWRVRAQTGQLSPALQSVVDAGLPLEQARTLTRPWTNGLPSYQSAYTPDTDGLAEMGAEVQATAALPLRVGEDILGVFVVALFGDLDWSVTDRVVLETIVRSLGVAIEGVRRVQELAERTSELENERAALEVFAAYTEQIASETDVLSLCDRAFEVMKVHFSAFTSAYFEVRDGCWKALAWAHVPTPEQERIIRDGLPLDVAAFEEPVRSQQPVFIDMWDPERHLLSHTPAGGPVCLYPLVIDGEVLGLFTVGLRVGVRWKARDRAMMRALGRSLTLALERTEQTRRITRQRDLLDARTHLLTLANEDMEAFTYSVSHDLRTPVRHIQGFNELLRASFGAALDPKAQRYLNIVNDSAVRMNTLIDAMLDLSRSSRVPLRLVPVDLNALVAAVQAELEPEVAGRQVVWEVGSLPPVTADGPTLRQVISNLLANALKYTRTREKARIEVWAEERQGEWAILVRDNGVGFDPTYRDRLFGVFQRLHSERDFEGTGVGLATVKRIVAKHQGQVLAEGRPDHGATFGFTLPK